MGASRVILIPATPRDEDHILGFRNEPDVVQGSLSGLAQGPEWFQGVERYAYVISHRTATRDHHPVGYVLVEPVAALSIVVGGAHRGQNIGTRAIEQATFLARGKAYSRVIAEVRDENAASRRAFTKAGYREQPRDHLGLFIARL